MAAMFIVVALVLPRVSATVVEFLPAVDTYVLCTGSEYVTVTLGPDGSPIDVSESTENQCTLSDSVVTPGGSALFWHALARNYRRPFVIIEHPHAEADGLARLEPTRAPPVLI